MAGARVAGGPAAHPAPLPGPVRHAHAASMAQWALCAHAQAAQEEQQQPRKEGGVMEQARDAAQGAREATEQGVKVGGSPTALLA